MFEIKLVPIFTILGIISLIIAQSTAAFKDYRTDKKIATYLFIGTVVYIAALLVPLFLYMIFNNYNFSELKDTTFDSPLWEWLLYFSLAVLIITTAKSLSDSAKFELRSLPTGYQAP